MWRSWTSGRQAILTLALCALAAGCNSVPTSGIDPSGDRIFAAPVRPVAIDRSKEEFYDQPLGQLPWDDVGLELQPRETVASVGSEVVLIAGVCGPDGYLRTNRRLEWSIDPGSVGQFVAVGETGFVDLMLGDFNRPRKITNTFAIGSTLRSSMRLNRGTCRPEENVYVSRGQGWISLTSPAEGTSHVTVFAPEVYKWESRLKAAMIHWVDAQWRFPPPAINPAGSRHVFTTTVIRQTTQVPCERWRVRYEITGGPPAGFLPDGAQAVEVPTDSAGQASVEIFQKEPKHGTNKICIQVIRPGDLPGANGQRLVVGSGTTMKTWTAADLAVKKTGPTAGSPGATLMYRIDISNPGDLPAKDVVATEAIPDGLTYVGSNPPAETVGRQLQWRLGELGARQRRTIDVTYRAERQGSVVNCVEVTAAGGLKVSDCATTTIATASLDVRVAGPQQATVGSEVSFDITVRNLSQAPAAKLIIKDRLDAGLEHPAVNQQNAIERLLGDLAGGASQQITVKLRVTKPGRLCHTVEVAGPGITPASAQACLMGVGSGGPAAGTPGTLPPFGGAEQPKPTGPPSISVKMLGPKQPAIIGDTAQFTIDIANTGTTDAKNLKVLVRYDDALRPTLATDGYDQPEGGGLAWKIDNLPAGGTPVSLGVHCKCEKATLNACNRVTVSTSDGGQFEDKACLEIRASGETSRESPPVTPPDGQTLTMSVVGLRNPVAVGKELTYEIMMTNTGSASLRQVSVAATVPEGMVPNPIGTVGPGTTKFAREGNVVRFDPVFEVKPNESLMYRVRVLTKKTGKYKFRAELTSPTLPQPIVQEAKETEVF